MDVRDYIAAGAADFSRALREWLAIPSVSADPARHGDVRASAEWLAGYLRETGFPVVQVWETGGLPAVYAHWPAADPGAQRVLVYGHHDVQPAALEDGWDDEPFAPHERDGRIFGRGTSDDKGQVLFHALGVRALLAARDDDAPPVSITMLIEGEEESGSPNFAALLEKRKDELKPDVIVISDTTMWAAGTPSICTGMRGLADAEITLTGPSRDLHSGSFGGGVPNPAHALAALLAGLHDADGRVTLPGFYDDVVPLTEEERALLAKLPVRRAELADRRGRQRRQLRRSRLHHPRADLGAPDRRGQRPVGRAHRTGRQDDHPEGRARQAVVPAGRRSGTRQGHRVPAKLRGRECSQRRHGNRHRARRRAPVPLLDRLAGRRGGPPGHATGVRHRGAVHQGGRQRPGGGPGRHPRRAACLRGRGA